MRTSSVLASGGVSLALDTWGGDGLGFLCVHGLASNARMWEGMAEALAGLGHAVAAVDLRGHGRSEAPQWGYDFPTVCDDLVSVLGALRSGRFGRAPAWQRPVVVGQSWGANVALELAFRSPGLIAGVACVDGGTIDLAGRFDSWEACAAALAPPRFEGTAAARFEAGVRAWHPSWPESGIRGTLANFEVRPDGTVAPWLSFEHHMQILRSLYEHRPATRYPWVQVPVLLVPADNGDASWTSDKRAGVEAALASIPVGRAQWFSPADHDIHAQFPDELAKVLHGATTDGFFA